MSTSIYFYISYPSTKKVNDDNDTIFVVPENNNDKPECIYNEENYQNNIYYYSKIFKVNKSLGKGIKKMIIILNLK